jgi:SSS family solute:Na+ symporter
VNTSDHLHTIDLIIVAVALIASLVVGCTLARTNEDSDSFFMAGRVMPGWAVGASLVATVISAMTFLALPAYSYKSDWRWMATCLVYPAALVPALIWFMPFFRKIRAKSAYEYFEQRFGAWARVYVASGFVLTQSLRMGIILFATSLALEVVLGVDSAATIIAVGMIVVAYCTLGGLKAVIWTDVVQTVGFIIGGAAVLLIVVYKFTGSTEAIVQDAFSAGKLSLGPTTFEPRELSFWAIFISHLIIYMQWTCTDQMFIQRYCAPRTLRDARWTLYIGMLVTAPIWAYFIMLGTALWAFFNHVQDPAVASLSAEEVFPHFIVTQMPHGLSGLVAAALCMAALSTLSSSMNAAAATTETDFYRRFIVKNATERHYLAAGRLLTVVFGILMITIALVIRSTRTMTLIELQAIVLGVFGSGLLGIFILGFATRTSNQAAAFATAMTIVMVIGWLILAQIDFFRPWWPHELWIGVVGNVFIFLLGISWDIVRRFIRRDVSTVTPVVKS